MLPLDDRLQLAVSTRQINPGMIQSLRGFAEASLSDKSSHYAAFVLPNDYENILLGLCRVPGEALANLQEKFAMLNDPKIGLFAPLDGIGQFEVMPLVRGYQAAVEGSNLVLSESGFGLNLLLNGGKSLMSEVAQMGAFIHGTGILTGASGIGLLMMLLKLIMAPSRDANSRRAPAPMYFPHYAPRRV